MAPNNSARKLFADVTERTVPAYVEAFLGLLLASGTTALIHLSTVLSAAVAAIPAGLAVAKGAVGTLLGRTGTASWLPAKTDPASTPVV
ncbi:hypothetical protein QQY24_18165 [Streptomyces sp. TG1A-8]|uniref:hypothetical protein n=1 Tax=unclassified Streptomyces TaxID=2593676 RepID=UPI00265C6CA2|nr:hypothetical protein [Streptomyces sp. TG1A-8]MDO0927246.1 hypothetical protein [Streptomyces sp. TG1A-8]